MSRFHSYLISAEKLIRTYKPGKPFNLHAKNFFSLDKKFGSRDRRMINSLCYYYFRTGKAFMDQPVGDKILSGIFLCESDRNEILHFLRPELDAQITAPISGKLSQLGITLKDIFPFGHQLGEGIDENSFIRSLFKQPPFYLRIRPGHENSVNSKLKSALVEFEMMASHTIRLTNNLDVGRILKLDEEAVVQDLHSQKVLDVLDRQGVYVQTGKQPKAWDCCAASGGKSILLFDKLKGNIKLTVSDIRENILINLRNRLETAGIENYSSFCVDISSGSGLPATEKFCMIVCDAPCTGSGTWSRNPEQLFFFEENIIGTYAQRQQKIIAQVSPHLEKEGLFFYITCSAFHQENEGIVSFIKEKIPGLDLVESHYLKGYDIQADTMFVAVFRLH